MRHRCDGYKLSRKSAHRKMLFSNMANALIKHERIKTTLTKAKALRPYVERLVTKARKRNLHAIRLVQSKLRDVPMTLKLVNELSKKYDTRPGGYTRIIKLGPRRSDNTEEAIIEFV